jgi:hypothetical protein
MRLVRQLWRDDAGCVAAMEWMAVASILTLAAVVGLFAAQRAEDRDFADRPAAVSR